MTDPVSTTPQTPSRNEAADRVKEALRTERLAVVEQIRHRVTVEVTPTGNGQAARRVRHWLDEILDDAAGPTGEER